MRVPRKELPAYIADLAVGAFYERGVAGVGMEEIAARASVSKRTLYRHFPDKVSLLDRGLRARSDRWFAVLERETDPLLLFDLLTSDGGSQPYLGCVFVNATAQTASLDARVGSVARWHKARLLGLVRDVVSDDLLARRIMLLVEGALASAAVTGDAGPVRIARELVAQLVEESR